MAHGRGNPDQPAHEAPAAPVPGPDAHRVQHILLVSSLYDSFILAEDGQLNEALLGEYLELNLSQNPDLTRVSTGAEALAMAAGTRPLRPDHHHASASATWTPRNWPGRCGTQGLDIPVVVLAYNNRELTEFVAAARHSATSSGSSSGRATCASCWPSSSTSRTS